MQPDIMRVKHYVKRKFFLSIFVASMQFTSCVLKVQVACLLAWQPEVVQPFHFKMTPGIMLGPRCNHDLGILLRLPPHGLSSKEDAIAAMVDVMGDQEFYCSSYASKQQPHMEGLLHTLADGMGSLNRRIAKLRAEGGDVDAAEHVRRILHNFQFSANRRMHKGFPEMISHLLGKPCEYCSHSFVPLFLTKVLLHGRLSFYAAIGLAASTEDAALTDPFHVRRDFVKGAPGQYNLTEDDYRFRPLCMEQFPLYFFMAGCKASRDPGKASMRWKEIGGPDGMPIRQRSYQELGTEPILDIKSFGAFLRLGLQLGVPEDSHV